MTMEQINNFRTDNKSNFFRYHKYEIARGGNVAPDKFMSKIKSLGYNIKLDGGINWYLFDTDCDVVTCSKVLQVLIDEN